MKEKQSKKIFTRMLMNNWGVLTVAYTLLPSS